MQAVHRLAIAGSVFLLLAAACEKPIDETGSWLQPTAPAFANRSYPACTAASDCRWGEHCDATTLACVAATDGLASDFTLPDRNENSESINKDVTLSKMRGLVTVLYFGLSTCPVCWSQTMHLQSLLETLAADGVPGVMALVIDHAQGDGKVWEMARYTRLPILQDPVGETVWNLYRAQVGAVKDTFVVIDANGFVRKSWTTLSIYDNPDNLAALGAAIRDAAK